MNITEKRQIIQPGETIIERGQSSFFYCNNSTAPFKLRLSDGSSLIMSSRRRIKLNEPLDIFYLENTSTAPIEVSYTMGYGDFSDDSLFIEGSIVTNEVIYTKYTSQEFVIVNDSIEVIPSGTAKKMILQNLGKDKIIVFGLHVHPSGTLEINFKTPFIVNGTEGETFVLTEFE